MIWIFFIEVMDLYFLIEFILYYSSIFYWYTHLLCALFFLYLSMFSYTHTNVCVLFVCMCFESFCNNIWYFLLFTSSNRLLEYLFFLTSLLNLRHTQIRVHILCVMCVYRIFIHVCVCVSRNLRFYYIIVII